MNSTKGNELRPVSRIALEMVQSQRELMISQAVERSLLIVDDVAGHGEEAPSLLRAGFDFTMKMLESIMLSGSLDLMVDQLSWAENRLPYDGVFPQHLLKRFKILSAVMEGLVPEDHWLEIKPYLIWMTDKQVAIADRFRSENRERDLDSHG